MKIAVCLGNVPDTTTKVKFVDGATLDKAGIQWIINPWDELALTRAIELKEDAGNAVNSVTAITVGGKDSEPTIRKALAIGADDAIRVDAEPADAFAVASELAEVIKGKDFDIIMCGIESSDYNGSAVGGMLAEILDLPSVSAVSKMNISGNEIELDREIDGGKEVVTVQTPFVAVVQKGIAKEPRIAAMRGIMMARKKPLDVVPSTGISANAEFKSFGLPQPKAPCKMVDPANVAELVSLLQNEAKVL
ncbi:MAG: electron transfer flavoprotein subunit beta/FixA family protein [Prolixibacteraceae bacterium]|nr:electron transfer flavoprotein subunit beta/FixA family protein [Prolixibacteraceae bacterium]